MAAPDSEDEEERWPSEDEKQEPVAQDEGRSAPADPWNDGADPWSQALGSRAKPPGRYSERPSPASAPAGTPISIAETLNGQPSAAPQSLNGQPPAAQQREADPWAGGNDPWSQAQLPTPARMPHQLPQRPPANSFGATPMYQQPAPQPKPPPATGFGRGMAAVRPSHRAPVPVRPPPGSAAPGFPASYPKAPVPPIPQEARPEPELRGIPQPQPPASYQPYQPEQAPWNQSDAAPAPPWGLQAPAKGLGKGVPEAPPPRTGFGKGIGKGMEVNAAQSMMPKRPPPPVPMDDDDDSRQEPQPTVTSKSLAYSKGMGKAGYQNGTSSYQNVQNGSASSFLNGTSHPSHLPSASQQSSRTTEADQVEARNIFLSYPHLGPAVMSPQTVEVRKSREVEGASFLQAETGTPLLLLNAKSGYAYCRPHDAGLPGGWLPVDCLEAMPPYDFLLRTKIEEGCTVGLKCEEYKLQSSTALMVVHIEPEGVIDQWNKLCAKTFPRDQLLPGDLIIGVGGNSDSRSFIDTLFHDHDAFLEAACLEMHVLRCGASLAFGQNQPVSARLAMERRPAQQASSPRRFREIDEFQ